MPLPTRNKDEDAKKFINRCMSSDVMKKEYPDSTQRTAVCISQSRAGAEGNIVRLADEEMIYDSIVSDEKAGYPPNCNEGYVEKDGKCVLSERTNKE